MGREVIEMLCAVTEFFLLIGVTLVVCLSRITKYIEPEYFQIKSVNNVNIVSFSRNQNVDQIFVDKRNFSLKQVKNFERVGHEHGLLQHKPFDERKCILARQEHI